MSNQLRTISESRQIDAPVAEVWKVVHDTSRYAEWVAGVLAVTDHHGAATVGSTYAERNKTLGPLSTESVWTVREVSPQTRRVDTGIGFAPLHDLTNTFVFEPLGEGRCRMTYELTYRPGLGPLRRILSAVVEPGLRRDFQASMASLDLLLRSERAPGTSNGRSSS